MGWPWAGATGPEGWGGLAGLGAGERQGCPAPHTGLQVGV